MPTSSLAAAVAPAPAAGAPTLWRIAADAPGYTADDTTGAGARMSGGRWNRPGTALLYTSTSRALACLETVVHVLDAGLPLNRYLVEVTVPGADWAAREVFDPAAHVGWDAEPAGMVSLDWGTAWAASGRTLLAEVPSVIVPAEANVLINPAHPGAAGLHVRKVRRWLYDARLLSAAATPGRRRRAH